MKIPKLTITLLLVLWITHAYSLRPDFNHLEPKDGLKDGEINSIAQDKDGIMWFATWSGLISYDGYNFTHYRPQLGDSTSLPVKKIKRLLVDSENNLWIATSRYLCRFIKDTQSFITYHFENEPTTGVIIHQLSQVGKHIVIHEHNGFYLIPLEKKDDLSYKAQKLKIFHNGKLVTNYYTFSASFDNSLYLILNEQPEKSIIYKARLTKNNVDHSLHLETVCELSGNANTLEHVNTENTLYIGTENGLKIYSLYKSSFLKREYFPGINIQNVRFTSDNSIYCSTMQPGLLYINLHTGKTGSYEANPYKFGTILNNKIHVLFEDFSENLWIGHQGQGISILNLNQKAFHTYRHDPFKKNSLISNKVMCFEDNINEVFVGLRTGGINYVKKAYDPNQPPDFKRVKRKENNTLIPFNAGVWDMEQESESVFWVASDAGLLRLTNNGSEWYVEPYGEEFSLRNTMREIYIDRNNNLWCGGFDEGLLLIPNPNENKNQTFFQYKKDISDDKSLTDNIILTMVMDSKGRFWIGTFNGLNVLDVDYKNIDLSGNSKPKLSFKRYVAYTKEENYLNNNEINCIYENFDGKIWIATQGGGINILDPATDTFEHITVEDGLPSNDVLGILSDNMGTLWISTAMGLVSYNQHSDNPTFNYYNAADGVQGDVFMVNSYFKSRDGELFFGGDNGFTRFYPNDIKPNAIEPKTVFTDLKFGNTVTQIGDTIFGKKILEKHINETEKIVLPFKHKTFSIGVAALHFQYPNGNLISYMLEGYDKKWRTIPAYYNNIYYSNLPPGTYRLKVLSVNSDNVSSEIPKTLTIEILKPWYLRWYALTFFIVFALMFVGAIIFIIVNRQKLVYDQKIDKIAIENTESKMMFLTNIAHGLKTPLSLVISPIDDLIQNYQDIKPEWKNHLFLIQRNANYLLKLINQIIDFRKLNAGKLKLYLQKTDIVRIVKEVVQNFRSFEKSKNVKLSVEIPYDSLIISADSQKIEEVLYNLISNGFKHTPKYRNININMQIVSTDNGKSDEKKLKITVFNEGETIPDKDKVKIFDRFYKVNESIEGAGIGLSFSKSLVEMHNGELKAESIPDRGMAFHIYLPYTEYKGSDNVDEYQHDFIYETDLNVEFLADSNNHAHKPDDDRVLKIVLVEDNEELRGFLKGVLSNNYVCYDATNGIEGLEIIKKIIPDIVISDIIMPEKDGYELCKEIKTSSNTCHIPVILLTAKDAQEHIISGYEVGADAYVTKPFDLHIIRSQISRLIKNRELIRKKYHDQNFMIEVTDNNLSKDDEFILNFRNLLEKNISDPTYNVKSLSKSLNISSTQLYRKIKALTGYSPVEFMRIVKLQKAYELLLERNNSVKEVCYLSGFNNISYFIKCFRDQFGVTPAHLKENGSIASVKTG